jgi:hypothetical protein
MIKMNKKYSFLFVCVTYILMYKDFEDINTDPNRPKQITPGVMLGQLV